MIKKAAKKLKDRYFDIYVKRTNPVVYRRVRVPGEYTLNDLISITLISIGYNPCTALLYINDQNIIADKNKRIDEEINDNDDIIISVPGNMNIRLIAIPEKEIKISSPSPERLPFVQMVMGRNIKSDFLNISIFNLAQTQLEQIGYCDVLGNLVYSEKELMFNAAKTENSFRKLFAPQTAKKEINMEHGMPMRFLLEKKKLNELRIISDEYGVFFYGSPRKAEIVMDIAYHFNNDLPRIFYDMTVSEFNAFKEFALESDEEDPTYGFEMPVKDWAYYMPSLARKGLITYIPKTGFRTASEILDYYDTWRDTDIEKDFIINKYLRSAMMVSARLYGVFNRSQYEAVAGVLAPEKIPENKSKKYYQDIINGKTGKEMGIGNAGNDIAFCKRELTKKEAAEISKARYDISKGFYLPTKDEIDALSNRRLLLSPASDKILKEMISEYAGYNYYRYREYGNTSYDIILSALHKKGDVNMALKAAEDQFVQIKWMSKESKAFLYDKLSAMFKKEAKLIPLMSLNGYSVKNCPKEILDHVKKISS